jgi:hypothetical protein
VIDYDEPMPGPRTAARVGRGSFGLLFLFCCIAPLSRAWAGAQEDAAFREQYLRASKLYAAKDYAAAIPALQAAYAIQPAPQLLYNIGQAYRRLEQWSSARVYFEMYAALSRDLGPSARQTLDSTLAEIREREEAERRPEVIEKTRTLVIQEEKPLPRWLRPLGISAGLTGLGVATAGAVLWGLDGQCVQAAEPPATQCPQIYNSDRLGIALTATGAGLLALGAISFGLSFRRPARVQKRMESDVGLEEQLIVPSARPATEPPPVGWNVDGTQEEPPPAGWDRGGARKPL